MPVAACAVPSSPLVVLCFAGLLPGFLPDSVETSFAFFFYGVFAETCPSLYLIQLWFEIHCFETG